MTVTQIYLGTQGWGYKDWVGTFYPPNAKPGDYLSYYAQQFNAVELDTTFYATPPVSRVDLWDHATPDGFLFTAKLPRSITHDRRLVDAEDELVEFVRTMERLGPKLGPLLIQLPPDFTADEREALEDFLSILPSDVRFAAEFRHRSWLTEETADLLRERRVAWTVIDLHYMPKRVEMTSDFAYFRWLGDRRQITRMHEVQIDRCPDLDRWSGVLEEVGETVQRIYGFTNNHYSGHSPADVRYLRRKLGLAEPEGSLQQGTLL